MAITKIIADSITSGAIANTPAFSASGDDQSIANGTETKVAFNIEDFDTDGNYDHLTNYRFTPTTSGKYLPEVVGVKR